MQLSSQRTITTVVIAMLCGSLFLFQEHAFVEEEPILSKEDRQHISNHYRDALAALMSTEAPPDETFWRADGYLWYAVIRVVASDRATPEFHFALWRTYDQKVHARLTRATGASLYNQVQKVYLRNPAATGSEMLKALSVSTIEISDSSDLRRLAVDIEEAQVHAIPSESMIMDPITYQFRSVSRSRMIFISAIAAPGHTKDENPVIRWADRVRRLFEK